MRLLARSLRDGTASVHTLEVDLATAAAGQVAESPSRLAGADDDRAWLVVRELTAPR